MERARMERARMERALTVGCLLTVLAAGCGAAHSAGTGSHPAASRTIATEISPARLRTLAARYLAIARPANHRLEVEVDGYGDAERHDLTAARNDLRAEAATERRFDEQLLRIRFPSRITTTARATVAANRRRIALTGRQALSPSLAGLRSLDRRHKAADAAVETQVRLIRLFLGLPPPATS